MTLYRHTHHGAPVYLIVCACGTVHTPTDMPRRASAARAAARGDGWRAQHRAADRKRKPDLCPACRESETKGTEA